MTRGCGLVATAATAYTVFCSSLLLGQGFELPIEQKGTINAEVWTAGTIAQHDSSTAFDTWLWTSGARFGRILTTAHGPGWLRGALQWDFGLGPIAVFSPAQTAYGFELDPIIGRWNFVRDGKTTPYFEMAGGVAFTNANVPPGDTSSINIAARAGVGWQIFTGPRRSFDVGLSAWHLSNAWTGHSNPSANGLQVLVGYHWFLKPRQQGENGASRPQSMQAAPKVTGPKHDAIDPAPTINGSPGMFTVETAEALPKGAVAASAYLNRFSRAPGSVSVLSGGVSVSGGLTKKITLFAQFEPYRHLHVAEPSELSLNFPAGCPHNVFKAPIYCSVPTPPNPNPAKPLPPQSSWKGPAAAYVPGFPFAAQNVSDYGPLALGFKVNFWSETRNDPLSVSLGADFFIPTESAATELAKHGAQTGTFDYSFTLGLSKTFRRRVVVATNVSYLVTGNPKANGETLLTRGDQITFGQGFIFPIRRRLQFVTEYTMVFFQEGHGFGRIGIDTQNTSHGPSEPVDGIWGLRWNMRSGTSLGLGYRYMLNLHQVNDRSGFIFQISNFFRRGSE